MAEEAQRLELGQLGHEQIAGLLVVVIVAIDVTVLIPYLAWFFTPDGRRAQR